jgi:hypothetical protein
MDVGIWPRVIIPSTRFSADCKFIIVVLGLVALGKAWLVVIRILASAAIERSSLAFDLTS